MKFVTQHSWSAITFTSTCFLRLKTLAITVTWTPSWNWVKLEILILNSFLWKITLRGFWGKWKVANVYRTCWKKLNFCLQILMEPLTSLLDVTTRHGELRLSAPFPMHYIILMLYNGFACNACEENWDVGHSSANEGDLWLSALNLHKIIKWPMTGSDRHKRLSNTLCPFEILFFLQWYQVSIFERGSGSVSCTGQLR